jgi:N-acetylglutamate synthase-like GNAT family acetyltransferase
MIASAGSGDLPEVVALLRESSLPIAGVEEHIDSFLVARTAGGGLVGCVGLETYGAVGLLRSLAVRGSARGSGLGTLLVERLVDLARSKGVERLYLLTTTAEDYFPRFGFARISREEADPKLDASAELRGACPASAVLMSREL